MSKPQYLRPCPFCAGSDLVHDREQGRFHVWCLSCGGAMVSKPTSNAAIEAWNRRDKKDDSMRQPVCPSCHSTLLAKIERTNEAAGSTYTHFCQTCKTRVG